MDVRKRISMCTTFVLITLPLIADDVNPPSTEDSIAAQRMAIMRERTLKLALESDVISFPKTLRSEPLFRYDDLTRGYVDGAIWRDNAKGRPKAIITSELHKNFLGVVQRSFTSSCHLRKIDLQQSQSMYQAGRPTRLQS